MKRPVALAFCFVFLVGTYLPVFACASHPGPDGAGTGARHAEEEAHGGHHHSASGTAQAQEAEQAEQAEEAERAEETEQAEPMGQGDAATDSEEDAGSHSPDGCRSVASCTTPAAAAVLPELVPPVVSVTSPCTLGPSAPALVALTWEPPPPKAPLVRT